MTSKKINISNTCANRGGSLNNARSKAGISLITVLLFMMVATIAATATYKWITSEARSSSSRMLEREAYQSSMAGIQNARAWMTYHANDVGDLIRQYKKDKKPILLDNVLKHTVLTGRSNQKFSVWLTGVNTEKSPYKLKILSQGFSRGDKAKHSEVAILDVTGLYQVKIPGEESHAMVDFNYAYFGGSFKSSGNFDATSAAVNGNWEGNPASIKGDFIVTGNATLSGNNSTVNGTACFGGNASFQNQGITTKDLFVGGIFKGENVNVEGDAYFNNGAEGFNNYKSQFKGNVTIDGLFDANCNNNDIEITGNLVTLDNGIIVLRPNNNHEFKVEGNVWMPGKMNIAFADVSNHSISKIWEMERSFDKTNNTERYRLVTLGGENKEVYIRSGHKASEYNKGVVFDNYSTQYRQCDPKQATGCTPATGWNGGEFHFYTDRTGLSANDYYIADGEVRFGEYSYNGISFYGFVLDENNTASVDNAFRHPKTLTYHYFNYKNGAATGSPYCWDVAQDKEWSPKCGVTPWFTSKGNLKTDLPSKPPFAGAEAVKEHCDDIWEEEPGCDGSKYKIRDPLSLGNFESYASKGCAKDYSADDNNLNIAKLNSCYDDMINEKNGQSKDNLYNGFLVVKTRIGQNANDRGTMIKANVIIIIENKLGNALQNGMPPVEPGKYVFLYLKEGAEGSIGGKAENYFIYSEKEMGQPNNLELNGTLYLPSSLCFNSPLDFNSGKLTLNPDLIQALTEAGIICGNDGTGTCSGVPSGSSGGSSSESSGSSVSFGGTDEYYISTAPQLSISLETQYTTNEEPPKVKDEKKPDPSFIVLPRIIYLTKDAKGKLSDYYGLIPLNTDNQNSTVEVSGVSCENSALKNEPLSKLGEYLLPEGYFKCEVNGNVENNSSKVPFWVIVKGENGFPEVGFKEASVLLDKNGTTEVQLELNTPTTGGSASYTVTVSFPMGESNWVITPHSSTCSGTTCEFNISTSDSPKTIFTVKNEGGSGTLIFQITECNGGCQVDPNRYIEWISTKGNSVTVTRKDVPDSWCKENGEDWCDAPNCNETSTLWVNAKHSALSANCFPDSENKNNTWSCDLAAGTVRFESTGANIDGCEIHIQPDETVEIDPDKESENYTLHASLKKKSTTFYTGFEGNNIPNDAKIYVYVDNELKNECSYQDFKDEEKKNKCSVTAYADQVVSLYFGKKESSPLPPSTYFRYWSCKSGVDSDCSTYFKNDNSHYELTISGKANNTVYAYFNDDDDYCFFDDFRVKDFDPNSSRSIPYRSEFICGANGADKKYCLSEKDGYKWKLISGDQNDIYFPGDGSISLKGNAKAPVIILSTIKNPNSGTLKAAMHVPSEKDGKDAGLILRANNANEYLLLSVYADNNKKLKAKLCYEGSSNCSTEEFSKISVSPDEIILISAGMENGKINVIAYKNSFSNLEQSSTITFTFDESPQLSSNVGFKLAGKEFKLLGIGWNSKNYACFDTYPTLNCSFRAKYPGGIVPKNENVAPWVGFSWWVDALLDFSQCNLAYYYNGNDAFGCNASNNAKEDDYKPCEYEYYRFSEEGVHGYIVDNKEKKSARVAVDRDYCIVYGDEKDVLLGKSMVSAHCGKFRVGDQTECKENVVFSVSSLNNIYEPSNPSGPANLRNAYLIITFRSSIYEPVTLYLVDENGMKSNSQTISSGTNTVDVSRLENDDFDPEKVTGVYISGTNPISGIRSECKSKASCTIGASPNSVTQGKNITISYKVENCSDQCSFELKRDGNKIKDWDSNKSNYEENTSDLSPGKYTYSIEGQNGKYDFNCSTNAEIIESSSPSSSSYSSSSSSYSSSSSESNENPGGNVSTNCWFTDNSYKPGQNAYFQFENLKNGDQPRTDLNYKLIAPDGTSVGEGVTDNRSTIQINNLKATFHGGVYTLYINGEESCRATMNVREIKPSSCEAISEDWPVKDKFKAKFDEVCEGNVCNWYIKNEAGNVLAQGTLNQQEIRSDAINCQTGTFTMWIEDTEGCSITINDPLGTSCGGSTTPSSSSGNSLPTPDGGGGGGVPMSTGSSNVLVPCGSPIHLTGQCNENSWGPFYLTIDCHGQNWSQFEKTVGGVYRDQNNSVQWKIDARDGVNVSVSTSCGNNTLECSSYCDWNP